METPTTSPKDLGITTPQPPGLTPL